jgi:cell division protein FtsB
MTMTMTIDTDTTAEARVTAINAALAAHAAKQAKLKARADTNIEASIASLESKIKDRKAEAKQADAEGDAMIAHIARRQLPALRSALRGLRKVQASRA